MMPTAAAKRNSSNPNRWPRETPAGKRQAQSRKSQRIGLPSCDTTCTGAGSVPALVLLPRETGGFPEAGSRLQELVHELDREQRPADPVQALTSFAAILL